MGYFRDGGHDGLGERGAGVGIQFIEVEAVGFPVLVQAEGEMEARLVFRARRCGRAFGGLEDGGIGG